MKACFLKLILFVIILCNVAAIHTLDRIQRDTLDKPKHKYGESTNILSFSKDGMSTDDALRDSILLHPEVKDRKIVVVSIIGAYRKGKSFLMDYCLRFMYANYKSIAFMNNPLNDTVNWMGDPDEPLTGFSWKSGVIRETTGIQVWSDVFLHENNSGEKIAIVLVDTQGLFDPLTPAIDNSRIFALSTLFSSVQIFNLQGLIHEDQLLYLQMATDFARFAISHSNDKTSKPFQKLLFLNRDWPDEDGYGYGFIGGRKYIKEYLKPDIAHEKEHIAVREFIPSSFEEISCFLMPQPGKFIGKKIYNGRWSEMDEEFKSHLFDFVESLLSPSNLVVKKINNKHLTSKQLNEYMKSYFEVFKSNKILKVETIYEATAKAHLVEFVSNCIEQYKSVVDIQVLNYSNPNFNENLENNHQLFKNYTLLFYKSSNKMGSEDLTKKFMEQLNDLMDKEYEDWQKRELVNQKNYNDEIGRIQEVIDARNVSCTNTEGLYQQKLKELEDRQNEIANLNQDLVIANQEINLKTQSLTTCHDKLIAADKVFQIRDQSCNKTEEVQTSTLAKLQDSQQDFTKLNGNYNTALAEAKAIQKSLLSSKDDYTKLELLHKLRDQSCNATEIAYKKTFNDIEICKNGKDQLQKDLDNAASMHVESKQYCYLAEKRGNVSKSHLDKNKSLLKVVQQELLQSQMPK